MSTSLIEVRSRLKALRTMHADTLTHAEREAWVAELALLNQLDAMLLERLNARALRASSSLREVSP